MITEVIVITETITLRTLIILTTKTYTIIIIINIKNTLINK